MIRVVDKPKGIVPDVWLAKIFGRDVYRLSVEERLSAEIKNGISAFLKEQNNPVFLYAKTAVGNPQVIASIEEMGFHLIDTQVTLEKFVIPKQSFMNHCVVRFATPQDRDPIVRIARENCTVSRFHLDPLIPRTISDTVKEEWVKSYFSGERGDQMIAATIDGQIAGFLQLLYGENGLAVIDLIATDKHHRQKGVARDMVAFFETKAPQFSRIRAGTQISNAASLKFYEQLGFQIQFSQYVFHYHYSPGTSK